jgi:hypothetical protein
MARSSHTAIFPGGARLAVRGRMVLDRVQSFETNQKLALALMERVGLGFSSRGFGVCRFLVAPEIKEQL